MNTPGENMDGFFVIFLITAVIIIIIVVFRNVVKKNIKKAESKTYHHPEIHTEDYLNDTNDPRNILHPSNPAGPNYFDKHFNRDD